MRVHVLCRPLDNISEAVAIQYSTKANVTGASVFEKGMLLLQMQP